MFNCPAHWQSIKLCQRPSFVHCSCVTFFSDLETPNHDCDVSALYRKKLEMSPKKAYGLRSNARWYCQLHCFCQLETLESLWKRTRIRVLPLISSWTVWSGATKMSAMLIPSTQHQWDCLKLPMRSRSDLIPSCLLLVFWLLFASSLIRDCFISSLLVYMSAMIINSKQSGLLPDMRIEAV